MSPIPLFDPKYVRQQGGDGFGFRDIFDYLANPDSASLDPHFLFSRRYYCLVNSDVGDRGVDPFLHFVRYGWKERRTIHPFFRAEEFRRLEFPADCNPTEFNRHLVAAFANPGLASTQLLFDVSHYLRSVVSSEPIATPLQHYLTTGWQQNSSPFPLFDQTFFQAQKPQNRNSMNSYVDYLCDFSHEYAPNKFFDPAFYLRSATVAPTFRGSLLEHFVRFGAADGASPHRMVAVFNSHPSRYSGFDSAMSFTGSNGSVFWLCTPADSQGLAACLNEIREIEPELPSDFLDRCGLHSNSRPIRGYERALIAIVRKCARCNCLVVSQSALGEDLVLQLFSPAVGVVSNARPWLTLLSGSMPLVRYWHILNGCRDTGGSPLPADLRDSPLFMAHAIVASMPNTLVMKTDTLGIALLRTYGPQVLGAIRQISLLIDCDDLGSADRQWLFEYLATTYSRLSSLVCVNSRAVGMLQSVGLDLLEDAPRMVNP